jgi:hypothetical protein
MQIEKKKKRKKHCLLTCVWKRVLSPLSASGVAAAGVVSARAGPALIKRK